MASQPAPTAQWSEFYTSQLVKCPKSANRPKTGKLEKGEFVSCRLVSVGQEQSPWPKEEPATV